MKIVRKDLADFINTTPAATATYAILGADLEEFNKEFNDEVESTKNILGESSIKITNGNAQGSVTPYYAEKGTDLFAWLQNIIEKRLELDDRKTDTVRVHQWETPDGALYPAMRENVHVELVSAGGDTTGYQIPFNVHYTGETTEGAFDPTTKTFTVGTWSGSATGPMSGTFTAAV